MDSPETLAIFGTQHTGQRQTKHKNTPQHKNMGVNPGAHEW